jgi:hypothetical protein
VGVDRQFFSPNGSVNNYLLTVRVRDESGNETRINAILEIDTLEQHGNQSIRIYTSSTRIRAGESVRFWIRNVLRAKYVNIGDGTEYQLGQGPQTFSHTFEDPGIYQVTVTSASGNTVDWGQVEIRVTPEVYIVWEYDVYVNQTETTVAQNRPASGYQRVGLNRSESYFRLTNASITYPRGRSPPDSNWVKTGTTTRQVETTDSTVASSSPGPGWRRSTPRTPRKK